MRKLFCMALVFALLFSTSAICESLDLSAFTPEQLAALQQMIDAQLSEAEADKGYDNTVDVLNAMIANGAPIDSAKLIDYTAETDPNGSIGTVGSYSHKTDFGCSGYASGIDGVVGGTIEYFEDSQYAQNRFDYLKQVYIATPMLADRVVYKIGNFVLRTDLVLEQEESISIIHALENELGIETEDVFDPKGTINLDVLHGIVVPEITPEPAATKNEPVSTIAPVYKELRRGAKGNEVAKLQARLKYLGFLNGLADGDFGPATERAVIDFETANNLEPNGVASVEDQNVLFEAGVITANGSVAAAYDPYEVCPIEISSVDLKTSYGTNYVTFTAKNISSEHVRAVSCAVRYFNAFGDRISDYGNSEVEMSISDIGVGKSVSVSTKDDYTMFIQDAATVQVAVTRVLMQDGTNLVYDEPVWFEGK